MNAPQPVSQPAPNDDFKQIAQFIDAARQGLMARQAIMTSDKSARFYSDHQRDETLAAIRTISAVEASKDVFEKVYDKAGHSLGAFRKDHAGDTSLDNAATGPHFPTTDVAKVLRDGLGKRHAAMQAPKLAGSFTAADHDAMEKAYLALGGLEKHSAAINKAVLKTLGSAQIEVQPLKIDPEASPDVQKAARESLRALDPAEQEATLQATRVALKEAKLNATTPPGAKNVRLLTEGLNALKEEFKERGVPVPEDPNRKPKPQQQKGAER